MTRNPIIIKVDCARQRLLWSGVARAETLVFPEVSADVTFPQHVRAK